MLCTLIHATIAAIAASITLRRHENVMNKSNSSLLPFDCYVDKGADYQGLQDMALSGRTCKNWLKEGTYAPTVKGIGNHHYCRNPEGSKDKPWCFTVDPKVAWEYCEVSECKQSAMDPKPWKAPKGSKSKAATEKGPCKYTAPEKPGYKTYKAGRACMDHRGDTWWLITNNKTKVADVKACKNTCSMLAGSEYMTFFEGGKENCGCYRTCVLVPQDQTIESPTVYKLE